MCTDITLYTFLQVSWVASKQPDDPPKCRPGERTWVCFLSSQFFNFHTIYAFFRCHCNWFDNEGIKCCVGLILFCLVKVKFVCACLRTSEWLRYYFSNHDVEMSVLNMCVCMYRAEIMEQLIQSSDLFVMQVEMDVYTALKKVHENKYNSK